ncbi:hypothetical protein HID58_037758 [Brassica napus]|uniref:Uncharacterized protein n=1 Tax=Brassica napus TaxID=3708 RepID=A0ABQ8BP22_BRANA|nr:hypothetical protein HID58_037758 [Brassica napus]
MRRSAFDVEWSLSSFLSIEVGCYALAYGPHVSQRRWRSLYVSVLSVVVIVVWPSLPCVCRVYLKERKPLPACALLLLVLLLVMVSRWSCLAQGLDPPPILMLRSHPPTGLNFEWQKRIGLGYLILLRFRVASPVESLRLFSVFFLCNLPFFVGCGVSVWPRLWRFSSMIPLDCKDGWLLSELEAIIKE